MQLLIGLCSWNSLKYVVKPPWIHLLCNKTSLNGWTNDYKTSEKHILFANEKNRFTSFRHRIANNIYILYNILIENRRYSIEHQSFHSHNCFGEIGKSSVNFLFIEWNILRNIHSSWISVRKLIEIEKQDFSECWM